jgi:uncharacterized protein (TIGR02680 family)
MNRAGILNFWCYDDDVLNFEDGRMILRGANGSGKSVTMQSLIPLVLDGDKRPERLDPFGSRDRRIEYYLIGEVEKGHTDRTGYLWIEFYHPLKKLYKTIGIGLRAHRGIAPVVFWGFLLEDGRRINQDFYLYDRTFLLETGKKRPLNRKQLEEEISAGGQVVQEQTAYREMVNKSLFGFREVDAYKDLLKLLLELRSPKLSKGFKPSSIYDILTRALPPLKSEELSTLTDVIEDMDQIAESLEELRLHVYSLEEIERIYDRYNCFLLYHHSDDVIKNFETYEECSQQLTAFQNNLEEAQEHQRTIEEELKQTKKDLISVEAQLEVMENSEGMNRKRELEILEKKKEELDQRLANLKQRIKTNFGLLKILNSKVAEEGEKLQVLTEEQRLTLEELDSKAQDMEFYEHNLHRRFLERNQFIEDIQGLKDWIQELENHKKKLVSVQQIAREEKEAYNAKAEAEIRLGEVSSERGKVEKEQIVEEKKLDAIQQKMKEELVRWHQSLKVLCLSGEQLRQMLGAITQISIDNRSFIAARGIATEAYKHQNKVSMQQLLEWEQKGKSLQEKCEALASEIQQWLDFKEPEPERTESKKFSRRQRNNGTGAPFYEVCEFVPELTASERAQLEATLMQAGILDAWIAPGEGLKVLNEENGEETWIEPLSILHKRTLSSVLYPVLPVGSGLSKEDILSVLNCFGWSKEFLSSEERTLNTFALISANGRYLLGPLSGRSHLKERAEFIGAETRRKTKELEIIRLEAEKKSIEDELSRLEEEISMNRQHSELMQEEWGSFPDDQEIQEQLEILYTLKLRLKEKLHSEQLAQENFSQKLTVLRNVQTRLIEETSEWSSIKKEPRISEALDDCQHYKGLIIEIRSICLRYHELYQYLQDHIEQQQRLKESTAEDEGERLKEENQEIELNAQITRLRKLMQELGMEELYQQVQLLKLRRNTLNDRIDELNNEDKDQAQKVGRIEERVKVGLGQLSESRGKLDFALGQWESEWKLVLIPRWREKVGQLNDEKSIRKTCKEIIKEYHELQSVKRDKVIEELTDIFNRNRSILQEYAMIKNSNESARIFITSNRDQMNPLTPAELLRELKTMEEEQQVLLTDRDRALYEEIIIGSVGKAIRNRIHHARDWVRLMDELMRQQNSSSGLRLSLKWVPLRRNTEEELDTELLVELLMKDAERMSEEESKQITTHFRTRILRAKQEAIEEQSTLSSFLYLFLDYRSWFEFRLEYRKGQQSGYSELTDSKFNALSGGEKATAMYIPLFAATYARYSDAGKDAPKIISLDEAFAGVDETNIRELFFLLTEMGFDYIMTSQSLWGCYDTVPQLAIYDIQRSNDADVIALCHYRWNGERIEMIEPSY